MMGRHFSGTTEVFNISITFYLFELSGYFSINVIDLYDFMTLLLNSCWFRLLVFTASLPKNSWGWQSSIKLHHLMKKNSNQSRNLDQGDEVCGGLEREGDIPAELVPA